MCNNTIKKWEVTSALLQEIEIQEKTVKLIELLQDNCMRDRHWKAIKESAKENFSIESEDFNFGKLIDINLLKIADAV